MYHASLGHTYAKKIHWLSKLQNQLGVLHFIWQLTLLLHADSMVYLAQGSPQVRHSQATFMIFTVSTILSVLFP